MYVFAHNCTWYIFVIIQYYIVINLKYFNVSKYLYLNNVLKKIEVFCVFMILQSYLPLHMIIIGNKGDDD